MIDFNLGGALPTHFGEADEPFFIIYLSSAEHEFTELDMNMMIAIRKVVVMHFKRLYSSGTSGGQASSDAV